MDANRFGQLLTLTTFGESHGPALGAVLEGCPAGVEWSEALLLKWLERRRPGHSPWTSARKETDQPEILSGVFAGKTLGTPIAIVVKNQDARSQDYAEIQPGQRAGHADDVWRDKFLHSDLRGGGRSSGRETLARVIGGSVAQMIGKHLAPELSVTGFASQIGPIELTQEERRDAVTNSAQEIWWADQFPARFPQTAKSQEISDLLTRARAEGHSYGGEAQIVVRGLPRGLGQPVFRKLKADLAAAVLSVGASYSFILGDANAAQCEGSEFHGRADESTYGGIRGGISTGDPIQFSVGFKPTSSVLDVAKKGRHDPCILPRALPVLEAMVWLVLVDHLLWQRLDRI